MEDYEPRTQPEVIDLTGLGQSGKTQIKVN
jgi:hypothetical protein